MKVTFGADTLGDDSVRHAVVLENPFGGQSLEQVEALFRAANVSRFARANVQGEIVFTCTKSHADYATALAYFKAEYGRLNSKADLKFYEPAASLQLTMANAICRGVQRADSSGLRWGIRYTMGFTTIT